MLEMLERGRCRIRHRGASLVTDMVEQVEVEGELQMMIALTH